MTEEFLALAEAIPGAPGDDYPVFSQPPDTSFTCGDKIEVGGTVITNRHDDIWNNIIFRATMEIPKLTVRVSIFVQMTEWVDCSSTASSAPTGQSLTSNTSSATGGSMSIVHW